MAGRVYKSDGVLKVSEELGLIFGYAIVCKENGEPYYDLQGDHISEEEMLKAATEFMRVGREAKEMHKGDRIGDVLYAWPMTEEMAESLDMVVTKTGLLVGIAPEDPDVLEKAKSGELAAFSIGGVGEREEVSNG